MYYNRWAPPPDELYHFGVKGMRWGIRKAIERSSEKRKAREKKRAKDLEELIRHPEYNTKGVKATLKEYWRRTNLTGDLIPSYSIKKGAKWIEEQQKRRSFDQMNYQNQLQFQQAGCSATPGILKHDSYG